MENLENGNIPRPIVTKPDGKEIATLSISEQAAIEIKEHALAMKVESHEDIDTYEKAAALHKRLKTLTSELDTSRKAVNEPYQKKINAINALGNKIMAHLNTAKKHLADQRKVREDYEARIKREQEEAEAKRLQDRVDSFAKYGIAIPLFKAASLSDEDYENELALAKSNFEVLQALKAEEQEELRQLKENQRKLAEEKAAIERERQKLEDEKAALQRAEEAKEEEARQKEMQARAAEARKAALEAAKADRELVLEDLRREYPDHESAIQEIYRLRYEL